MTPARGAAKETIQIPTSLTNTACEQAITNQLCNFLFSQISTFQKEWLLNQFCLRLICQGFKGYYFDNYVHHKDLKLGGDLFHALFHHALYHFALSSKGTSHEELLRENNQLKTPTLPSTTFLGSNPDLSSTNAYDMRGWELGTPKTPISDP